VHSLIQRWYSIIAFIYKKSFTRTTMDVSLRAVEHEKGFSLLPTEIIVAIAAELVLAICPEEVCWE